MKLNSTASQGWRPFSRASFALLLVAGALVFPSDSVASVDSGPLKVSANVDVSGTATISWTPAEGQAIELRVRHFGGDWSAWMAQSKKTSTLVDSRIGEKVAVQVRDATTNEGFWTGRIVVAQTETCSTPAVSNSTPIPELQPEQDQIETATAIQFSGGATLNEIDTATQSGLDIQQIQTSLPLPSGQTYTAGMEVDPVNSNAENVRFFQHFVSKDAKQFADDLASGDISSDSSGGTSKDEADVASLATESEAFDDAGTARINQISVSGSTERVAEFTGEFEGRIADATSVAPKAGCGDAAPKALAPRTARSAVVTAPSYKHYTPRSINVKTFNQVYRPVDGQRQQVRKAVLHFSWCPACMKYWSDRASEPDFYANSGVEVQLDLGLDTDGLLWGRVPWTVPEQRADDNDDDAARDPSDTFGGVDTPHVPRAWSANFPCAYADDYNYDEPTKKALTIGSSCPPGAWDGGKDWRWAQILLNDGAIYDDNDSVRPSVQPVRRPLTPQEYGYCGLQSNRTGSCMFGVGSETEADRSDDLGFNGYSRSNALNPNALVTPGADRFFRKDVAADVTGWKNREISACVDVDSYIAYTLTAKDMQTVFDNLSANVDAYSSSLPYNFVASGLSDEDIAQVLQPYVGLQELRLNDPLSILSGSEGYAQGEVVHVIIAPQETLYLVRATSDLGATFWVEIVAQKSSISPDIWKYVSRGEVFPPSGDSHEQEFDIKSSIESDTCVLNDEGPPPS